MYIQYTSNSDARSNYEVVVTAQNGRRVPKAHPAPVTAGPGIRVVYESSSGLVAFDPEEKRFEKFPLSAFVELPNEGKVNVTIGRGLFAEWNDPFKLGASQVLWCSPIRLLISSTKKKPLF